MYWKENENRSKIWMAISHVNHCFRNYLFAFYVILITLSKLQNKIEYKTCQQLASFGQLKDYKQTCNDCWKVQLYIPRIADLVFWEAWHLSRCLSYRESDCEIMYEVHSQATCTFQKENTCRGQNSEQLTYSNNYCKLWFMCNAVEMSTCLFPFFEKGDIIQDKLPSWTRTLVVIIFYFV